MKIRDITETVSVGSTLVATKNGKPLSIQFNSLPHPAQYHHINQELKSKIPQLSELDRMNLARELASKKSANFKGVEFMIQDKKPREMKW